MATAPATLYRLAGLDLGVEACRSLVDEALALACLELSTGRPRAGDLPVLGLGRAIVALELRELLELGWPPVSWHLRSALATAISGCGYAIAAPPAFGPADVRAFAQAQGMADAVELGYRLALVKLEDMIDERRLNP